LYRQDLVPDDSTNTSPFIRMAGQAIGQRSTLTVNHGIYAIDTTASPNTQAPFSGGTFSDGFLSMFLGGETYYFFDLYSKPDTRQTFRVYVDGGPSDATDANVYMVRADQGGAPPTFTPPNANTWPTQWTRSYDSTSHILEVTMNMEGFAEFKQNYDLAASNRCKPANYCSFNSSDNTCSCSLPNTNPSDPVYKSCQRACSQWSMKDVNCPKGGCYGFAVVFPSGFFPQDQGTPKPPPVTCTIKSVDSDWTKMFMSPVLTPHDACTYATLPSPQFCP